MAIKSYYERQWRIKRIPFPRKGAYAESTQAVFVPEIFGDQWDEFRRKFFLAPLEIGQPLMGAVWSLTPGDPKARGYGKSTLMGESAKLVSQDFGLSTLVELGIDEEDARQHPILASYASFTAAAYGGVGNIDAVGFQLLKFLLREGGEDEDDLHLRMRELAEARLGQQGVSVDDRGGAIASAIRTRCRKAGIPVDIRGKLEDYLEYLVGPDTESLNQFLAQDVHTWHQDRNGLKYLQLFVVFAELAGIQHLTFFVDQVEDFTSLSGSTKIQKNVKIIRDALIESEPFASRASFVFQFHPQAHEALRFAWDHEDLPSLAHDDPLNKPVVVVLKGLDDFSAARVAVERFLGHATVAVPARQPGIAPFTDEAVRQVWEATRPIPRNFLTVLHDVMRVGADARVALLDKDFVAPKLQRLTEAAAEEAAREDEDERLA
ncbi:MAG: hypothetical protein HY294_15005 [Candidatus Rokubacteria bacterium]|nr:hypothetical protein [Candidatus Rokubacteria bacterium]